MRFDLSSSSGKQNIEAVFNQAKAGVRRFAASSDLESAATTAFGVTADALMDAIRSLDRLGWPQLVLVDSDTLNGARGAYDSASDTIYLSKQLMGQSGLTAVTAVLIEEIGHALDARLNAADSPGDEGEIFAAYVLRGAPSAEVLAGLKAENDHSMLTIGGNTVNVELAGEVLGSITLDGSLADWTAADQIDKTLSSSGYDLYGKAAGGSYVFAIKAPVAIGANTTTWLNTDQDVATGFKIWGWAGGAEYNINFDASGVPRLYTGDAGQTLVSGATVSYAYSADRSVVEFAVSGTAIGSPKAVNTLWDINNSTFLPTDFSSTQYAVLGASAPAPAPVVGLITLDGKATDWTLADAIDKSFSVSGYDISAKATGGSYVFAIQAPLAIGANTTLWLNTDQNASTGYQIWGSAGGAEFNINFDANGTPRLYTGAAGQTLLSGVEVKHAYSADHTFVEFAVPMTAIGSPGSINTLWDINDNTFLPTNFGGTQYEVVGNLPARTDFAQRVGIVYSETTAKNYFAPMAYSQLFMAAQNQAAMAGVQYEILTEADLTNLAKLANFDALVFPRFSHVESSQLAAIEKTLKTAVDHYDISLIAAGEFMTNDQTGAALAGDSYARMKSLLGLQLVTGGWPATVNVAAGDTTHPMMQDYTASELIRSYSGVGWLAFTPTEGTASNVFATQSVNGQTYGGVVGTTLNGGNNVHFATEAFLADNNLLWQAIDYAVNGGGVSAGLQLSRNTSIVASRVDMDQAMESFEVNPDNGAQGIYEKMMPIVEHWKATYNYVASYYVDIGDQPPDQMTDWKVSGEYYRQLLALGNELGSHSLSHPHDVNTLTSTQIQYEFQQSKLIIEEQMSQLLGRTFTVDGAAVPGAPENLASALAILQYYNYLSGGYSGIGAGYPSAFGYLNPTMAGLDKVYLAPNVTFDFSLVEFKGLTPAQASAEWQREWAALTTHSDVPVLLWPWHDYGPTEWQIDAPNASPYTTGLFTDFIARAHAAGAEFVTLDDLAERISAFGDSKLSVSVSGNTVTANVTSPDAGKFALDLDNLGTQKIARVSNWYAYDDDSVFLPSTGGTYTIQLGTVADDVTRIISLPMRAELLSLTGNGTDLAFSVFGEGRVVIDLVAPAGRQAVVSGANIVSLSGDKLTLDIGAVGHHDVSVKLVTANQPPTITSNGGGASAAISIAENGTAVTTVAATDSGGAVTYLISGGADAAKFMINSQTGALTFRTAPDFERPGDVGANNVYDVTVAARDTAGALDTQALTVSVTNIGGVTLIGTSSANTLTGGIEEDTLWGRGGADTLSGGAGNDRLYGEGGNDVLIGGAGTDTLTGGAGRDRFDINSISEGLDTITDFARGSTGDRLDIRDVLVGYTSGSSNINNFVRLSGAASTTVAVNADGVGTDFVSVATLQNVAFTSNLLNEMMANGNLIVA